MAQKNSPHFFFLIFFFFSKMATTDTATTGSGNTKQTPGKARNFILTINEKSLEHYEDIKDYILNLKSNNYYLCCEHIGQENKHYHIYCQFKTPIKLSVKKLYGAHYEKSFGSAQQNISYVKAEDSKHKKLGITSALIDEEGTPKINGGFHTVKDIKEMNEDELEDIPAMYYNTAKKIKADAEANIDIDDWHKDVKVYWISGPSGIGKSNEAKNIVKKLKDKFGTKVNIIKYVNGFYIGVSTAKIAIYDDFRDSHMKPSEFINLIDYNKHYMNVKGNQVMNNYLLIIFTSVQRLSKIYLGLKDEEPRIQWERRIEEIKLGEDEELNIDIDDW